MKRELEGGAIAAAMRVRFGLEEEVARRHDSLVRSGCTRVLDAVSTRCA